MACQLCFICRNNISILSMYHSLSIHLLEKYLDCFQMLTIMNKATVNICVHVVLDVSFQLFGVNIKKDDCSTYDSEHLFTYSCVICAPYLLWWLMCLFRSFAHFLVELFVFLLLYFKSSLDSSSFQIYLLQMFSSIMWIFSFSWHCFSLNKYFNIMNSNLSIFPFMDHACGVVSFKSHY